MERTVNHGKQKTKDRAARSRDAGGTGADRTENGAAAHEELSAYARKMLIDGYIVNMDTTDIRAQTAEIQKIGVNVNQIAKRLNSMGSVYAQDIEDIKGALTQIWQLQRYILSSQR